MRVWGTQWGGGGVGGHWGMEGDVAMGWEMVMWAGVRERGWGQRQGWEVGTEVGTGMESGAGTG